MRLNRCKYCGEFFNASTVSVVCKACKPIEDAIFSRIEEYLKQYPNSNALQISEGLEVPILEVLRFIDEGRLTVARGHFEKLDR